MINAKLKSNKKYNRAGSCRINDQTTLKSSIIVCNLTISRISDVTSSNLGNK